MKRVASERIFDWIVVALLARALRLWARVEVDRRQLGVLEGEAADEGRDRVHEAKGRDDVRLAIVEQEFEDAKDEEDGAGDRDHVANREAHLEGHLGDLTSLSVHLVLGTALFKSESEAIERVSVGGARALKVL